MSIHTFTEDLIYNFKDWNKKSGSKDEAEKLSSIMKLRHRKVDERVIRSHCYKWVGYESSEK